MSDFVAIQRPNVWQATRTPGGARVKQAGYVGTFTPAPTAEDIGLFVQVQDDGEGNPIWGFAADGAPGPPGIPEIVSVEFAYGDAAGIYYTALGDGRIVGAEITYRVALNGTTPVVLVGLSSGGSEILAAADSDPKTAVTYSVACDVAVDEGDGVWITITPSGSTVGSGVLTLYLSFD